MYSQNDYYNIFKVYSSYEDDKLECFKDFSNISFDLKESNENFPYGRTEPMTFPAFQKNFDENMNPNFEEEINNSYKIGPNVLNGILINEENTKKNKKKGRKNKNSDEEGDHTKYTEDNMIKRIRINYINFLINKSNKEINNSYHDKTLLLKKLNPNQANIYRVEENKIFIHKKLKDIFSDDISNKYKTFEPKYNQKVIEKLMNEENLEKKEKFTKLFNITFIESLEHLCGKKIIEGLEGFGTLDEFIDNYFKKEEEEYKEKLRKLTSKYKEIVENKKKRKKKETKIN